MKKIFLMAISLFAMTTQGTAQKFIDIYQHGSVVKSLYSAEIDSVNITEEDNTSRHINFYGSGSLISRFPINTVDSIKVVRSEDNAHVYLGIVGFNQELYPMPISILNDISYAGYTTFVNNLTRKDGTLLYYGVDQALDMLTQYNYTTPLSSVNLITFTDGLDQGSLMMTTSYHTDVDYLNSISQRIASTKVRGIPLTAYSLGLRGNDITNYSQFQENLRQLASSPDKAQEVYNIYDVQSRLQEIADQIISISNYQTIRMTIPGQSNGTKVRFTFDGNSPTYSTLYIEGTFNLVDRSLRDVTYHGIRASSSSVIQGQQNGIFVTYTFTGLQRADGNGTIPTNYIRQYNMVPGSNSWQINSEFSPENNTQTTETHSGSAIMLALDCSSSLGGQFDNMKQYAKDFIAHIVEVTPPEDKVEKKDITIYLKDPGWPQVYFYAWDGNLFINDNWPGVKVTATKEIKGTKFYYRTYNVSAEDGYSMNIIFDQGSSEAMSVDITFITSDRYYEISSTTNKFTVRDITSDYGGGGNPDPGPNPSDIKSLADFTNGDFESWTDGQPDGWLSKSSASNATLSQSTDAHGGSYSVKVGGATSAYKRLAYEELELEAGTYTMTFYCKAAASGGSVRPGYVPIKDDGSVGSYVYGDYVNDLGAEWVKVEHTFELAEKTTICLVVMNSKNPGADILIDDFTIAKN